ncbi:MAG TPA: hypothetical protein VN700_12115 [Vicinamibacterales bacterium]|nr:hypothetical protein [Vicinamibacterales bacterium]
MKKTISISVIALFVAACATAFAQSKSSFAGKWTLVPDPNAAAAGGGRGGRGGGLGQEFTATQDEKVLTVITNNPQMGEIKAVYNLDGSETKNPLSFGGQTVERVSKAKWNGAKFVITTTTNFNGNNAESTQTWSLDASGNLVVETTSNFGGTPTTTKATYKKN